MDDVEEELERIHSVSESVHSTTPRKTWFKEQIERAKYAMHLITLEFKDRDLERKYRNYTQNYRFWGARTTTLILWSVFFVTLICAAPVYKRNHTWSAWPTMFRLVQFSANFAFFYVPLLFMRRYPIPWLQKNWQMWFTLNTALSATTLIVTSAAIMESSTFGILRRCETEDLRTIVGHNFSCTDTKNMTHDYNFEQIFANWELKVFHADAYIWGTGVIIAVQKLDWIYSLGILIWITLVQIFVNSLRQPRQDFSFYFGHVNDMKFEDSATAFSYSLFAVLALLMSTTLTRELSRLRKQRFACLVAMGRRLDVESEDLRRMTDAWILDWGDIQPLEPVARGTSGEVWRGLYRNKWEVAVKMMYDTTNVSLEAQSETRFLQRVRHPRLVMFVGCGRRPDDGNIFLVLEYCEYGSMTRLLLKHPSSDLPWSLRLSLLRDVSDAMVHLHSVSMIHRDLKCENMMICADESHTLRAKVCDFGLSRILGYRKKSGLSSGNSSKTKSTTSKQKIDEEKTKEKMSRWQRLVVRVKGSASSSTEDEDYSELSSGENTSSTEDAIVTSVAGTPSHMAPELLPDLMSAMKAYDPTSTITAEPRDTTSVVCTPKVDIYAYAIVMWEVLERRRAWNMTRPHQLAKAVMSGRRPNITVRKAPYGYISLLRSCWHQDPLLRPTFFHIRKCIHGIISALHEEAKNVSRRPSTRSMETPLLISVGNDENEGRDSRRRVRSHD